jgi:hypothetical protein
MLILTPHAWHSVLMTYTCIFAIDHADPGSEETPAPAPVEATEPEQDQGKPGASNRHP